MFDTIISRTELEKQIAKGIFINYNEVSTCDKFLHTIKGKTHLFRYNPIKKAVSSYDPIVDLAFNYGTNKYVCSYLKIQVSAPKFILGDSYFMPSPEHLSVFCLKMSDFLKTLHIDVPPEKVEILGVSQVAFCFNCLMPSRFGLVCNYINLLKGLSAGQKFRNIKNSEFFEETYGLCLREYNGCRGSRFYDLFARMKNHPETMEEKSDLALMEKGQLPNTPFRIELTYQKKQALEKKIGKKDPLIRDFFNRKLCREILNDYANEYLSLFNLIVSEIDKNIIVEPITQTVTMLKEIIGKDVKFVPILYVYASAARQMGLKEAVCFMNEQFGHKWQSLFYKYRDKINKHADVFNLKNFPLVEIAHEIKRQINEFNTYSMPDEANALYAKIEACQLT